MKILLLITGLFFSGGLFADMDKRCVALYTNTGEHISTIIAECERNNILVLHKIPKWSIPHQISYWCRHDREINYLEIEEDEYLLTCVLYSIRRRD